MKMTAPKQSLKSLTFTVLPKREANPVQERRTKTIARLEEQKQLFNDPSFTRTVRTSVKSEDGVRTIVEKQQRVLPCWIQLTDGSCLFTIRSGWKPIEFDKGKSARHCISHARALGDPKRKTNRIALEHHRHRLGLWNVQP